MTTEREGEEKWPSKKKRKERKKKKKKRMKGSGGMTGATELDARTGVNRVGVS